jgi:protein-S-isoprenylcysteine O-methyltransferase Ste14
MAIETSNEPDTRVTRDNAGVIAWPPFIFAACAGVGIVGHFVHAVPIADGPLIKRIGGLLAVCSGVLAIWAQRAMKAAGTNIRPDKPALVIVKRGPYRFTRNPLYLSLCMLHSGMALWLNDWVTLSLVLPLFAILHFGVVLREEAYLERKFGEEYLGFKRRVHRWI